MKTLTHLTYPIYLSICRPLTSTTNPTIHPSIHINIFHEHKQQSINPSVNKSLSEEELLEEVLEQEKHQQQDIEDQIADFETWEHSLAAAAASHNSIEQQQQQQVVCPICCESMLQQSSSLGGKYYDDNSIVCPNEACPFRLGAAPAPPTLYGSELVGQQQQSTVSLAELKERLRRAFENHSVRCGQGTLTFEMQPIAPERLSAGECLVGSCQQCDVRLSIT